MYLLFVGQLFDVFRDFSRDMVIDKIKNEKLHIHR